MGDSAALKDYEKFQFSDGRWTRDVYRRGKGPAVIVIHEVPGISPFTVRFADRVAEAGMSVFLPSLFGDAGREMTMGYGLGVMAKAMCVRREFNVWHGGKSSPIVDWLRALAKQVHGQCGSKGVGVVGMCFTGGFALAMMTEPAVVAPVLSQPALPMAFLKKNRDQIDASPEEIACAKDRFEKEDLSMIGLRFKGDPMVPEERFATYRRHFGDRFEAIELEAKDSEPGPINGHSVLTVNLQDRPGTPTKKAEERVIQFFRERVGVSG